jgi:hypothetical protein
MIEDMGMSSVRLYLTGVTFTKYSGYDPEAREMMQELEKSFILHQPKTIALEY